MLKKFGRFFLPAAAVLCCILALVFVCVSVAHASSGISSLRIGQGIGNVRMVFDADSNFDYKVFLLNNPQRLVIDAKNVKVDSLVEKTTDNNFISKTRVGKIEGGHRIVCDLKKPVVVKKAFMLPPQSRFGYRFVVDLEMASEREFNSKIGNSYAVSNDNYPQQVASLSKQGAFSSVKADKPRKSKKVIVLDPGHGGKDPGAIGVSGIYEKNLTLAMAKELKRVLEKNGEYKVFLTRNTDIFIPLRERVNIARRHDADLFLSIHADSVRNRTATGLSVYTLSENASDREAAALAERENKADVIAGLDFTEHTKEVADVLINLAQRETMNRSSEFATFMVKEMKKSVKLVGNTHRFAGFAVLKAPDVPAVLLEMGYLSNKVEERQLKNASYRKKLATSASRAIDNYFDNMQRASLF